MESKRNQVIVVMKEDTEQLGNEKEGISCTDFWIQKETNTYKILHIL